jgi:hypothetical protein
MSVSTSILKTALGIFTRMSNMAIILPIPKGCMRRHRNLKDSQHERGWEKSAENLSSSPFKRDLWTDTNFRQFYLAGQPL